MPKGQSEQKVDWVSLYWPGEQSRHVDRPAWLAYLPAGHDVQMSAWPPVPGWNPRAQGVQPDLRALGM